MCRRCIIIKGRAVGKSTEPMEHECVGELKCDACTFKELGSWFKHERPEYRNSALLTCCRDAGMSAEQTLDQAALHIHGLQVQCARLLELSTPMAWVTGDKNKCVGIVEIDGEEMAHVDLSKLRVTESRVGMAVANIESIRKGGVTSKFIPGKTLMGDKPMATVTRVEVHDEDGEAVLKVEGVEVQYERVVPVGLTKQVEVTKCDEEDS
jgi:hypothetical protein